MNDHVGRTLSDAELEEMSDEQLWDLSAQCPEDGPDPEVCDSCAAWYVYTDGTMNDHADIAVEPGAPFVPLTNPEGFQL